MAGYVVQCCNNPSKNKFSHLTSVDISVNQHTLCSIQDFTIQKINTRSISYNKNLKLNFQNCSKAIWNSPNKLWQLQKTNNNNIVQMTISATDRKPGTFLSYYVKSEKVIQWHKAFTFITVRSMINICRLIH